uniref:Putative secreted protein n=1 Tax=Ixodes scapularis TaxID=6945 RepID=A0A4D5RFD7_IXOSC
MPGTDSFLTGLSWFPVLLAYLYSERLAKGQIVFRSTRSQFLGSLSKNWAVCGRAWNALPTPKRVLLSLGFFRSMRGVPLPLFTAPRSV